MQILRDVFPVPPQFFWMLPYVLTVVVLAGVMGRALAPAALGKAYTKE
jgi:simple sugar transport system permease protein